MVQGEDPALSVAASLGKVLSTHGQGFQYAVLKRAGELLRDGRSYWLPQASEVPVTVGTDVTHVDFVLKATKREAFLVAECKKADPARSHWCFVRAPFTWEGAIGNEIVFDLVHREPGLAGLASSHAEHTSRGPYHIPVELKTGAKGEGQLSHTAVSAAATQVLRATNGLINLLFDPRRPAHAPREGALFIPLIVTTATLWVSEDRIDSASLLSGEVKITQVQEEPWLWFNHNQNSTLQHSLERLSPETDLKLVLQRESTRSIAIVAAKDLDKFLGHDLLRNIWLM
jgi:hypothetical protein